MVNMKCSAVFFLFAVLLEISQSARVISKVNDDWFPVTIIHLNDMHAR